MNKRFLDWIEEQLFASFCIGIQYEQRKSSFEDWKIFKNNTLKQAEKEAGKQMADEIVLDDIWYNSCMNCGKFMRPANPYDFWCSERCKTEGEAEIKRLGEELAYAWKEAGK